MVHLKLAALLAFAAPAVGSTIPYFQVTDLGSVSTANRYQPERINEDGAVVGTYDRGNGQAFLWTWSDGIRDIAGLTSASDINDFGRVAGSSGEPVLWDSTRGIVALEPSGGGVALGINNADQAVGWVYDSGTSHAFLWDPVNGLQDLNALAGIDNFSFAHAINDAGQVVGGTYPGNSHALLWDPIEGVLDLTLLAAPATGGGFGGEATDINNQGEVIGYTDFGEDQPDGGHQPAFHAFIYHDGDVTDLGPLGQSPLGQRATFGNALNDLGQAVGYAAGSTFTVGWFFDGDQMWNLNRLIDPSLGWIIESANDINDAGQIIVTARRRDGLHPNHRYALLLDPTPGRTVAEPGTLILLGCGLALMFFPLRTSACSAR